MSYSVTLPNFTYTVPWKRSYSSVNPSPCVFINITYFGSFFVVFLSCPVLHKRRLLRSTSPPLNLCLSGRGPRNKRWYREMIQVSSTTLKSWPFIIFHLSKVESVKLHLIGLWRHLNNSWDDWDGRNRRTS